MITLRPATIEDAKFLFDLKNDEDTRRNAIVTEDLILWENHLPWLEKRLEKPGMNIIMLDEIPVGDVRFDYGDETEISIKLVPEFRGQGIARRVIGMCLGKLVAYIVDGNIPSMRTFLANGFKPVEYIKGKKNYYRFEN
jgi:RimJ/RimL family protein N-acetyltransferase